MKVKFNFNRRYGVFVSFLACGSSIWMLVTRFGFPVEDLIKISWICGILIVSIVVVAAPIALIFRWISEKKNK